MMFKAFHLTLDAVVTFTAWSSALVMAVVLAFEALHALIVGGQAVYHLIQF